MLEECSLMYKRKTCISEESMLYLHEAGVKSGLEFVNYQKQHLNL